MSGWPWPPVVSSGGDVSVPSPTPAAAKTGASACHEQASAEKIQGPEAGAVHLDDPAKVVPPPVNPSHATVVVRGRR
ncbi:hypothetical protein L1987_18814 [Smallanthus sonchifolius]|uniref:Uncharacterized protein n=1 Tax=Smallanthus sonchifolius TaxID=185202 RepID=A0ACB9J1K7_9ASTR|nr:hypothetical protein L1987_18814 [Smallanthus sonchifolius]